MSRSSIKYAVLALVVAGTFADALGIASAYAEQPVAEAVSIKVTYSDLDLHSAAGLEALYERLRGAARSACGNIIGRRISEIPAYHACYDKALEDAVSGFNSVQLTALHEQSGEQSS